MQIIYFNKKCGTSSSWTPVTTVIGCISISAGEHRSPSPSGCLFYSRLFPHPDDHLVTLLAHGFEMGDYVFSPDLCLGTHGYICNDSSRSTAYIYDMLGNVRRRFDDLSDRSSSDPISHNAVRITVLLHS